MPKAVLTAGGYGLRIVRAKMPAGDDSMMASIAGTNESGQTCAVPRFAT
jgi:hypothetical protein